MTNSANLKKRNTEKLKSETKKTLNTENVTKDEKKNPELKYGPLPKFPGQRVWTRGVLILGVLIYVWYFSKDSKETTLAKSKELYDKRGQILDCNQEYLDDIKRFSNCVPKKCGRYVSDKIVTTSEADALHRIAQKVMSVGGSSGGATIMDLNSGALSYNDKFINVFAKNSSVLSPADKLIYKLVKSKIQAAISETFDINFESLYLTWPVFFSRLTNLEPISDNDEYWHAHIDKYTYESFHYTSLIYLNDYGVDFTGGKFVFMDNIEKPTRNTSVEPRKGRVLMFTSGPENPHFVERVTVGSRFAMTVPFSCDPSKYVQNPELQ